MSIDSIKPTIAPIQNLPIKPGSETQSGQFGELFESAMKEANQLQNDAEKQIEGIVTKKDGVTTHSAMLALEKADIAFQLMSAVRSKIVRAYEEVLRTQV